MQRSYLYSIIISAVLLTVLVYLLHSQNVRFELLPLILGNALLAAISVISFIIIGSGLKSSNGHALIRAKYTAMLLKFVLCILVLVGYIFWVGKDNLYKPALFLLLGMYVVYSALEVIPLAKLAKTGNKKANQQ